MEERDGVTVKGRLQRADRTGGGGGGGFDTQKGGSDCDWISFINKKD